MSRTKVASVGDQASYSRGFNSQTNTGILFRVGDTKNIVARCSNIQWNIPLNVTQADEINTRNVKEQNYGRQDIITGRIGLVMNLENNDLLPTSRSLQEDEAGFILFIATGDDHKLSTVASDGTISRTFTDVFIDVKIVNKSGGVSVNQQRMNDVSFTALDHMTGLEYKKSKGSAISYPVTPA